MPDQRRVNGKPEELVVSVETVAATYIPPNGEQDMMGAGHRAMQVMENADVDLEMIKADLTKRFPELEIQSISFLAAGLDNKAYRVNHDYIFRVPRSKEKSKFLEREIGLMPLVQRYSDIPVPQYEFVSSGSDHDGRSIAGCKAFQGEQLTAESFGELPFDQKENFLGDIARFLKSIHGIPKNEALACKGIYETDDKGMYEWYADDFFPNEIFPLLSESEYKKIALCLRTFVDDHRNFEFQASLLHGDMKLEHLFTNRETHHIQGVIDFDPMVGDPDYDFMRLHAEMDKKSFHHFLELYGHTDPKRCEQKVLVFQLCRYAQKAHDFKKDGRNEESAKEFEKMKAVIATLPF